MDPVGTYKNASSPFDNPKADLALCTSDAVVFRVFKLILSQASPVFDTLLSVPQPPQVTAADEDYIDGLPVVRLTEDSVVIGIFLRCCYPIPNPTIKGSQFFRVYQAGHKYQAEVVMHRALEEFSRFAKLPNQCLQAFVDAHRLGLKPETELAAKASLHLSRSRVASAKLEGLDDLSVADFRHLVRFHDQCRNIVSHIFDADHWVRKMEREWPPMWDIRSRDCCPEDARRIYADRVTWNEGEREEESVDYVVKTWFTRYLSDLAHAVQGDDPIYESIKNPVVLERAIKSAFECSRCRMGAVEQLVLLTEAVEKEVELRLKNWARFEEDTLFTSLLEKYLAE